MIAEMLAYCGEYRATNIKNINGREGPGYECQLLKGDRHIGQALNYGDGGAVRLYFQDVKDRDEFEAFSKMRHPGAYDHDMFVTYVVAYWETIKSLKTKAKKRILALDPTDKSDVDENGLNLAFIEFKVDNTEVIREALRKRYPGYIWLNDALDAVEIKSVRVKRG